MMKKVVGSSDKKIDYRFKILYAIGIILIVSGHANSGAGMSLFTEWFPYYGFHLGIFLFASGYFYKSKYEKEPGKYIWKKVKSLIIPLVIWNLFYACFVAILSTKGFKIGMPITVEKLTTAIFTTGHQFGYNLGGWFVIPLFMIQVFNVIMRRCLVRWKYKHREWIIFLVLLGLGMLGVWVAGLGPSWQNEGPGIILVRFLTLLPFFELGILYKDNLEKYDKLKNWLYFTILMAAQISIVVIFGKMPEYRFAWGRVYEYGLLMPFISGALGIALWLRIARILEPAIGKSRVVNIVADNTFSIMINHFMGFWLVNVFFAGLSKIIALSKPFDWGKFKSTVWYHYMPFGMSRFEILYVAAGIVVPILMQMAINKAIKIIVKKNIAKRES